ncbi:MULTISPECIES: sigma-54 interaction domain-containing protein [unclassified Corallococcus]|uniref:sigma-54 interaction domain-containing protein n=1 Tax=unclassified Corallococcus TaxID=2685029 RepID=UPI001A8E301B|nr:MULTISPECIES: sigma-54 dependent transcriptional regulator [unclassified Corallococcus]MBN9685745.1 sigma-54-dependent Fis family transcriptional regulator [Corallococcus sp. NCSPR001]WAS82811.1 sigma-54 dependent transcriptional regulator [Corallococcus sp. NCRR]
MNLPSEESAVTRFHCEMKSEQKGGRARAQDERPGTYVDGVRWRQSRARGRSGSTGGYPPARDETVAPAPLNRDEAKRALRMQVAPERGESLAPGTQQQATFGELVATSATARASFERMARAAACDATVLLEGETGTGKSRAALAIHRAGARANAPFLVVDCGALPANLLESELFGHEKGAFTGAIQRRVGAFEEADGGTIFLDEIGELPAELQPKLLRVLENREIRRLGSNTYQPVNVRVIAATHRDLRTEVQEGRFRADLYFRLAVVGIPLPSLRERTEDIPLIVERILAGLGATPEQLARLTTPDFLTRLQRAAWPGNVRELRNHLERCLVFQSALPPTSPDAVNALASTAPRAVDASLTYAESRRRALEAFEHDYVEALLKLHGGKVSQAAAAADMDRVYLYRLLRRHGLKS